MPVFSCALTLAPANATPVPVPSELTDIYVCSFMFLEGVYPVSTVLKPADGVPAVGLYTDPLLPDGALGLPFMVSFSLPTNSHSLTRV